MFEAEIKSLKEKLSEIEGMRFALLKSISALEQAVKTEKTLPLVTPSNGSFVHTTAIRNGGQVDIFGANTPEPPDSITDAIRAAIDYLPRDFSKNDIEKYLRTNNPAVHDKLSELSIPNTLYKFWKKGQIKQIKKGVHGRPSRFVKAA